MGLIHIGKRTWVGIGATVIDGISVCDDCILGAGTVVVKNIDQSGTYVGMPFKKDKIVISCVLKRSDKLLFYFFIGNFSNRQKWCIMNKK